MKFGAGSARGILHRVGPPDAFTHARIAPWPPLDAFVQHHWQVRWRLAGLPAQPQETLPHPNAYLIVEAGATGVYGISTTRYSRLLEGDGFAFGVKFRPGGLRPFLGRAVSSLTDRRVPLEQVFGAHADGFEARILACVDAVEMAGCAHAMLSACGAQPDPQVERVAAIVDAIGREPGLTRVETLVERFGLSIRALQRLFAEYVGIGPKWVINRYRLHEAVDRLADGDDVDWSALAQDLGYFDQAHFIRDFRALVGRTPGGFARDLRGPRTS